MSWQQMLTTKLSAQEIPLNLVALSDEGNNTSASNALMNCSFCNLGEDEEFYNSYTTTETFASQSQILKKVYLFLH